MRPALPRRAILGALVLAAFGIVLAMERNSTASGEEQMIVLSNTDWARGHEPFDSDIAEIERLWGAPIPDHLMFIGGPDWPAWGRFTRHPEDPPGVIRGQVRDRDHFYEGPYRAEPGKFVPSPAVGFPDCEVSDLDGVRVLLHRRNQPPPVDFFFLGPERPEDIRRRANGD